MSEKRLKFKRCSVCNRPFLEEKCPNCNSGKKSIFTKYNNKPTEVDGYKFDSLAEAREYQDLLKQKEAGTVLHIDIHPVFRLAPGVSYEADFTVYYSNGDIKVKDVKGVETQAFKIKKKLFNNVHPLAPLEVIKR